MKECPFAGTTKPGVWCGCPFVQVVEAPDVWDYSLLFSQLKAELQNEDAVTENSGIGAHNAGEAGMRSCLKGLAA